MPRLSLLERTMHSIFTYIMEEAQVGRSVEPDELLDQIRYELEDHPRNEEDLKILVYNGISQLLREGEIVAIGSLADPGVKFELKGPDEG